MTEVKVRMSKEGPFPVNDELAGLVPMAIESEQIVLTNDIMENQQRDPIVLWKGEVVDGRCRMKALTTLGYNILYRELSSELTNDEVAIFVKSVNTRRNLTPTQKVMSACKQSLKPSNDKSIIAMAKSWGIGSQTLKNARYIAKHRPEFVQPLFEGRSVKITSTDGKETDSNKITTIYASIKREQELVVEDIEHAWEEDSYIKTQAGKEWYYSQVNNIQNSNDIKFRMLIAELANYKFSKSGNSNNGI